MGNAFLDELEKLANDFSEEPMNPDQQPGYTEDDIAAAQFSNDEEAEELLAGAPAEEELQPSESEVIDSVMEQAIEEEAIAQGLIPAAEEAPEELPEEEPQPVEIPEEEAAIVDAMGEEQVASDVADALREKVAEELISLATIAKLAECARGGEHVDEELQKQASSIVEDMVQDETSFYTNLEKVAGELFSVEGNVDMLFSREGINMVFEQLAELDAEGMDKQADENENALVRLKTFAADAISGAKNKVIEAANSAVHLKTISAELAEAAEALKPIHESVETQGFAATALQMPEEAAAFGENRKRVAELAQQQKMGRGVIMGGAGLAAAGALYGGKKLYDHTHPDELEEKVAGVLPDGFAGGTLDAVQENDYTGGIQKMAKELVKDFLKVAGAAGLVTIANDENQPMDLRKEASAAFDEIATMGRAEMDETLVKVAQQIYSEDELHEIVAGVHTDHLFDKVAYFVDAVDASYDEVFEKTANAGGVAAVKNFGGALKDASKNITNVIGQKKREAEAAGREYVGALKGSYGNGAQGIAATGTATGLAGGGLVGAGALAGYNALKNPGEYNMEQTANAIEEAVLAKQASVEAFAAADAFLKRAFAQN